MEATEVIASTAVGVVGLYLVVQLVKTLFFG
jgi:hypothetical protein